MYLLIKEPKIPYSSPINKKLNAISIEFFFNFVKTGTLPVLFTAITHAPRTIPTI